MCSSDLENKFCGVFGHGGKLDDEVRCIDDEWSIGGRKRRNSCGGLWDRGLEGVKW